MAYVLTDPSCVSNTNMTNTAQLADWPPVTASCAAATANLLASSNTGNCDACMSNTGFPTNCLAQCPACAYDWNSYLAACPLSNISYSFVANTIAGNVQNVSGGNGSLASIFGGDCYDFFSAYSYGLVQVCSDAMDYVISYSETMGNDPLTQPQGPNCPTDATDTVQTANGRCPAACQSDLSLISSLCNQQSVVAWGGPSTGNNPYGIPSAVTTSGSIGNGTTSPVFASTAAASATFNATAAFQLWGNGTATQTQGGNTYTTAGWSTTYNL